MPETLNAADTAWILTATALVLMMTLPGLALFYAGMVRKKNVLATLMQSFAVCCLVSVLWMVVGYSLAFSPGSSFVGGFDRVLLLGLGADSLHGTIPESLFMAFQMTFAIITPALISGAFAERMKFSALLWFSGLWVLLVYAPICHWVWADGGLMAEDGVLDFAGGTVVHVNAGIAGLVAAVFLGPRKGFGRDHFAPHNLVLTVIGGCMLWIGWFGFNAGSALAADGAAAMALVTTHLAAAAAGRSGGGAARAAAPPPGAAAAAGLSWMAVEWWRFGKPSVLGIVTGAVGGLVAVTPAAGFVGPAGALAIGAMSGVVCWWGATWLKKRGGWDDSLDCFGVHGVGGLLGSVLTGVFAVEAIGGTAGGLEGNWAQVGIQVWGVFATIVYAAAATWILLKLVDVLVGVRVDEETEVIGLDVATHGEAVP